MNIKVLFENKDVLVINKPAGLLVHGVFDKHGPKHSEETLTDWLAQEYPQTKSVGDMPSQRGGIVHRLDRETSGVMVIAKNQPTFEYLKKLFQEKKIQKTYQTLVWGRVTEKSGVINKPISIKDGTVRRTVFKGKMPREAVTHYAVLKHFKYGSDELTLLEVMPKTGRTHQIRVHLSSIGHPVVGDKLYGKKGSLPDLDRHFLHAGSLELMLPGGGKKIFTAELPEDLASALKSLT